MVELGCGSGETAAELGRAGHEVLGSRLRRARWSSSLATEPRGAVSSRHLDVGGDPGVRMRDRDRRGPRLRGRGQGHQGRAPRPLRAGAHRRSRPAGSSSSTSRRRDGCPAGEDSAFRVGEDWAILYTAQEDSKGRKLQRRITTFRKIAGGATYRRTEEVHRLRLWRPGEVEEMLRDARFKVQTRRGYGPRSFAPGHRVFVARA